ncbi:MAG: aminotransferase class V-fold PLP-dependent enzyme, partial [Gemmatimonadota bacterium]|nr:aminotransferase class V-fold PLP-dependent enzyme [Gemmatimonadota bacterium]
VRIMARVHGGEQEGGLRAGTPDIPALAGLHAWTREVRKPAWAAALAKCATLRDRLEEGIVAALPGASVNGDRAGRLPNTTHLHLGAVPGRALVNALALEGIAASRGSACAAGDPRPSHVLRAMGMDASRVDGSIRFSLGIHTTGEDIDEVLRRIPGAVESARAYAAIAQGQAAPPGDGSDECCGQPLFPA